MPRMQPGTLQSMDKCVPHLPREVGVRERAKSGRVCLSPSYCGLRPKSDRQRHRPDSPAIRTAAHSIGQPANPPGDARQCRGAAQHITSSSALHGQASSPR